MSPPPCSSPGSHRSMNWQDLQPAEHSRLDLTDTRGFSRTACRLRNTTQLALESQAPRGPADWLPSRLRPCPNRSLRATPCTPRRHLLSVSKGNQPNDHRQCCGRAGSCPPETYTQFATCGRSRLKHKCGLPHVRDCRSTRPNKFCPRERRLCAAAACRATFGESRENGRFRRLI